VARLAGPARFADLLIFDESDLPAALTKLETATLPGFERSLIIDFDEGLVFLAGRHHAFFEEDYAQLCSVLG
jgi:hypothetical protein